MSENAELQTTVRDDYTVEIPQTLREEIDLQPGETIQWDITDSGRLLADVVRKDDRLFEQDSD